MRRSPVSNIPTGQPLVYELDEDFQPVDDGRPLPRSGRRRLAAEAVANQGKK